jgi:hypothetical protein
MSMRLPFKMHKRAARNTYYKRVRSSDRYKDTLAEEILKNFNLSDWRQIVILADEANCAIDNTNAFLTVEMQLNYPVQKYLRLQGFHVHETWRTTANKDVIAKTTVMLNYLNP